MQCIMLHSGLKLTPIELIVWDTVLSTLHILTYKNKTTSLHGIPILQIRKMMFKESNDRIYLCRERFLCGLCIHLLVCSNAGRLSRPKAILLRACSYSKFLAWKAYRIIGKACAKFNWPSFFFQRGCHWHSKQDISSLFRIQRTFKGVQHP